MSESFFATTTYAQPTNKSAKDPNSVTLGMEFSVGVVGTVSAVRFFNQAVGATFTVGLYDASQTLLGTAQGTSTVAGWQQIALATPVTVSPGSVYTVAYSNGSSGQYAADQNLTASKTVGDITVGASAGVYNYGTGLVYPSSVYQNSDYYVDVVFTPGQQQQAPPPPPPPPPGNGTLILGVASPWNAAYHAAQPAPGAPGVQGQLWVPGPNGESELVWNVPQDFQYWEDATGRPHGTIVGSGGGIATDVDSRGGWANYEGSAWSSAVQAFCAGLKPANLWLNVPPFPKGVGDLKTAGTGAYNTYYTAIANTLAGAGFTNMTFRLAWEFEGNWYAWGWGFPGQDQANYVANYIAAYRQMALTIRAAIPNAKFVFNAADCTIMPNWQACYPGDDVVDFVAMDTYDGLRSKTTPASARWANDQAPGIAASQALALAHGKGWAVPEWAIGAMGDNPLYITNMAAAARAYLSHGLPVMMGYWNSTDPNSGYVGYMDPTTNPQSWAAYISTAGFHA